ncbi:MAG: anion transporter [Deltaproteobacteria bacterium]|nr:anion transporter [Deltaproteobacteria bacterium]
MDPLVLAVFGLVYLGMILGRLPGLGLDRTGVALLGALILLAGEREFLAGLGRAVDLPTLALLFGLMVVSAQLRLGGFYTEVVRRLAGARVSPPALLGLLTLAAGVLSALLANDIVCLAMAPMLVEAAARRGLDPRPFLLSLALAANVGSAATLIGNPQNMLIGQVLHLDFGAYLGLAALPVALGLLVVWAVVAAQWRGAWTAAGPAPVAPAPEFNRWQSTKGLVVLGGLVAAFLWGPWPREVAALAAAGLLLCSRRMRSREMLALVDWQLLVLFIGLFVVNHAFQTAGGLGLVGRLLPAGGAPGTGGLFVVTTLLSNLVSNVPAVMLLLPWAQGPLAGPALALASTLAGNLLLVGSIANLIVADQASRLGVSLGWRDHARAGAPVTLVTLFLAWGWLGLVGG